jgi:hypothetical protein
VIRWLGELPAGVLFPLFAAFGIAVTCLLDLGMRRIVRPETRERASPTAATTLQVVATIYAILIAFVIVDEYTQLRDTQGEISSKAASLSIVFENSRAFPDAEGGPIRTTALGYATAVVEKGLPHLEADDTPDPATDQAIEDLFAAVQATEPTTESERVAYESTVHSLDEIVATRAEIVDSSGASIPTALFWMLVVIGFTVMSVSTLLDTRHRRSHLFMLSSLALVIWITLALVVSMDYPFGGIIRVSDGPIREFIEFRGAR